MIFDLNRVSKEIGYLKLMYLSYLPILRVLDKKGVVQVPLVKKKFPLLLLLPPL